MQLTTLVSHLALLVAPALVAAAPSMDLAERRGNMTLAVEARGGPASNCFPFASPTHCVPTVCQCMPSGHIYMWNAAGGGCDPPWAYIAETTSQHPKYCN